MSKLEEQIMADRERKDFVKVEPAPGLGSVTIVEGPFTVQCAPGQPAEITRAEWEKVFKSKGLLVEVASMKAATKKTTEE